MFRWIYLVGLAALLLAGAALAQTDTVKAVAYVNGDAITSQMLARELVRMHSAVMMDSVTRAQFSVDKLVQRLVNDLLLSQEARSIGLDQDSAFAAKVQDFRDRVALKEWMKATFPDTFSVQDAALKAAYAEKFQRFDLRTLCVTDSASAAILADSLKRGASFDSLAKSYSVDKFKDKGGVAGTYTLLDTPPTLQPLLLTSKPGDLFGPQYLWRAWALIRVDKRMGPDSAVALDSVRAGLTRTVLEDLKTGARRDYAQQLKAKIPVHVDSVAADSIITRMALGLPPSGKTVIRVGKNRTMAETEIRTTYIHKASASLGRDPKEMLYETLNDKLEGLLLEEAAATSELAKSPVVMEPVKAFEDSMLVLAYLQDVVAPKVNITDAEVDSFYTAHKAQYHGPTRYKVATLTRKTKEEADEDLRKLKGGADFEWLARQNSIDDARMKGGERDWQTNDRLPMHASSQLDTMNLGEVTTPLAGAEGFVLLKLVDRKVGDPLPLDKVKGSVYRAVEQKKQLVAINETVKALRKSADIRIEEDVLKNLQIGGHAEPGSGMPAMHH